MNKFILIFCVLHFSEIISTVYDTKLYNVIFKPRNPRILFSQLLKLDGALFAVRLLTFNLYTLKAKMSVHFIYKNGKNKVVDEIGNEYFEMGIDTEVYPIDYITNYNEHLDCKLPENKIK